MKPPRVLVVSHTYTAAVRHAKLAALSRYVTLTTVAPRRWRDGLFDIRAAQPGAATSIHYLPIVFSGHILRYFYPLPALARIVRQSRPDLVFVEQEPPSLALGQMAWLKRWGRYRLVCFTWENIARRLGLPGLEHYNLARCDGVIAGNQEAGRVVRAKGFRGPVQITPEWGLDPEQFRPGRNPELRQRLGLSGFVAGFAGRFVAEKGLETLRAAAAGLPDVQLLLIGGGPMRATLDQWRAELGQRLCVVDAVPPEQMAGYLRALDVLVLPSHTTPTWKEQFGHVLIEAMACALPVVGSDSGAIPEVIGEAGLVVAERDGGALRQAVARLRDDPALRARLGQAGRARVLAHYTHDTIAAADAAFFRQVLHG